MKKLLLIATLLPVLAWLAAAQDLAQLDKAKAEAAVVQMKMLGAVRGQTVKGAPYSAEEVNETNQVLADGTRIHRETRTAVYRDSEGRTRRETPESITITDPVANVTYILNPRTMTGQKLAMASANYTFVRKEVATPIGNGSGHGAGAGFNSDAATFTIHMESNGGTPTITVNGQTLDPKQVQELIAKAKANGDRTIVINGTSVEAGVLADATARMADNAKERMVAVGAAAGPRADPGAVLTKIPLPRAGKSESLGTRTVEGVNAEGRRSVSTIEAGAIGNDRPIQVTGESWYSSELQTMVMSRHSDPRTGEENFRLTNINRNEPGAYLFQPPTGYTINERK